MPTNHKQLGLAYLATVYSKHNGGIHRAFVEAATLAARLMRAGIKIFSPIAHSHPLAIYGSIDPMDHSIWLPFDEAMMTAADSLIVAHMSGWQESFGVAHEIKFFEDCRKPIFDLDPATFVMTRRKPHEKPPLVVVDALARIAELDAAIEAYPTWGAALSAMDEERKELTRFVARHTPPLAHNKTPREQGGASA